jgi:hypothetical protein
MFMLGVPEQVHGIVQLRRPGVQALRDGLTQSLRGRRVGLAQKYIHINVSYENGIPTMDTHLATHKIVAKIGDVFLSLE